MRGRSVRKAERAGGGAEARRLTRCAGTWLEHAPDAAEQARIAAAIRQLKHLRSEATAFYADQAAADAFCLALFRDPAFAPLAFADELVQAIIARQGEPPVVEEGEEQQFSAYLRTAVLAVASPNTRRFLAAQLRRFLPIYSEAGRWREAIALDHSAFRTALGSEVTPFLAQMALLGLAAYYERVEE